MASVSQDGGKGHIGYTDNSTAPSAAQVKVWHVVSPVNTVDKTYPYTYDGRRNITLVSGGRVTDIVIHIFE